MTSATEVSRLNWPPETARPPAPGDPILCHAGTNLCLDVHGDPLAAKLVVFSDGNHHMALGQCVAAFVAANPDVVDVFYATTPPRLLVQALQKSLLRIGNLALSIAPNIFIGPPEILDQLVATGVMGVHSAFAESRGNVLLVRKGNPKNIRGVADLMRDDVRVAMSNPLSEAASFQVYFGTLVGLAAEEGLDVTGFKKRFTGQQNEHVVFSSVIHHREFPEILAAGHADVAMVYFHLALRYNIIFPETFDFVPLGGTKSNPEPGHSQRITRYHLGLIADGGAWGQKFSDFMLGECAAEIYRNHGLNPVSGRNRLKTATQRTSP